MHGLITSHFVAESAEFEWQGPILTIVTPRVWIHHQSCLGRCQVGLEFPLTGEEFVDSLATSLGRRRRQIASQPLNKQTN